MPRRWTELFTNTISGRSRGEPVPVDGAITGRVTHYMNGDETTLIYEGMLPCDILRYCQDCVNEGYLFAVELRAFPDYPWYDKALKHRTWMYSGEDCMGFPYTQERTGTLTRIVRVGDERDENGYTTGGGFLFVKDREDYEVVCRELADLIINSKPFVTVVDFSKRR